MRCDGLRRICTLQPVSLDRSANVLNEVTCVLSCVVRLSLAISLFGESERLGQGAGDIHRAAVFKIRLLPDAVKEVILSSP